MSTNSPKLSGSGSDRQKWTVEQDQILSDAVAKAYAQGNTINWHQVATHLPGRTNKHCRKRWHYKVANNFRKGPWTREEDDRLRSGVEKHGTKWTRVSQHVESRNGDQCWKRWNDSLNPEIDHSPWTQVEDELLLHQVEVRGTNWSEIVSHHFPGRTTLAAKNRHVLLQRRAESSPDERPLSLDTSSDDGQGLDQITCRASDVAQPSTPYSSNAYMSLPFERQILAELLEHENSPSASLSTVPSSVDIVRGFGDEYSWNMTQDTSNPPTPTSLFSLDVGTETTAKVSPAVGSANTTMFMTEPRAMDSSGGNFSQMLLAPFWDFHGAPDAHADQDMYKGDEQIEKQKTIHLRATCTSESLEAVMRDLSNSVNGMVISGRIQDLGYSVE